MILHQSVFSGQRTTGSRQRAVSICILLVVLFGFGAPVLAQSGRTRPVPPVAKPNAPPQDPLKTPPPTKPTEPTGPVYDSDETIRVEATLVSVPVVVSDSDGRYLPFLEKKHFRLYEDNVPQDISFFAPERVPFHVALVLDVSGSTFLSINDIKTAATAFVGQLREDDQVCVITFASRVNLLCDFTNDRLTLLSAIDQVRSGGSTKLYEAVHQTVSDFMRGIEGRKAMILLTDGEDTSSRKVSYRQAIDAVVESDVLTYVIRYPVGDPVMQTGAPGRPGRIPMPIPVPGMPLPWPWPHPKGTPPISRPPLQGSFLPPQGKFPQPTSGPTYSKTTFLYDLARATGGELYNYETMGSLSSAFTRIAEELRHIYVLGFYPTNPLENSGWRRLRVAITELGAKVRAREGYYARPPVKPGDKPSVPNSDTVGKPFRIVAATQ